MAKFDPDFSIIGTLAGDINEGTPVERARVNYINQACLELYGDLRGEELASIIIEISGDDKMAQTLIKSFVEKGQIFLEGKFAGKFVKFHSRIIDCENGHACGVTKYFQAGITDITEIVILKKLLYGTSEALKRAAEAADDDTGQHITRINTYSKLLAELYGMDSVFVSDISRFAQLHDIGKIKIVELIRLPRKLTHEEYEEVKKHVYFGCLMVEGLDGLEMAHDIIQDHHERWDGSGYPAGKKRTEISLAGRIVALVDVFDALVTARPYKEAFDYREARMIIERGDERIKPSHFDPQLLKMFLTNYKSFVEIHHKLRD